ncbi:MAG: hypothetical protein JW744_05360 [Candidatus Diapherotrites archaeon]|uniref:Uncharacterized protein n=1 Tax=Candidatus Iainarchaeum sp. TaxID=3101447 RepID=A0A938YPF5_9ARCH|nr:hypothetical protein [Candidatus Diapherotrites archaeon]
MVFEKFDFPSPSEEEIKVVKEMSKSNPEYLGGRALWGLQNFAESGFE